MYYANVYYTGVLNAALLAFQCSTDHFGGLFLVADPSIRCFEGQHDWMVALASVALVLGLVGMPLFFANLVFRTLPKELERPGWHNGYKWVYDV